MRVKGQKLVAVVGPVMALSRNKTKLSSESECMCSLSSRSVEDEREHIQVVAVKAQLIAISKEVDHLQKEKMELPGAIAHLMLPCITIRAKHHQATEISTMMGDKNKGLDDVSTPGHTALQQCSNTGK